MAQEEEPTEEDQGPGKTTYVGISIDWGKLLTIPTEFETKLEGGIDLTIKDNFKVLGELGYSKLTPQSAIENGSYVSEGIYYRAGLAYGGQILPKSFLYGGVMYGISQFSDMGTVRIDSETYDNFEGSFERTDQSATWFEVVLISEQEFRKNMFLGFKFRLRVQNEFPERRPLREPEIYSVPGYGRYADNSIPAFNLYFKYIIPFN